MAEYRMIPSSSQLHPFLYTDHTFFLFRSFVAVRGTKRIDDLDRSARNQLMGGSEQGLDSMEKEYLAAMRGERDLAVVS